MDSLISEENLPRIVQNSPFCRRLRIQEKKPNIKDTNTAKKVARCLFGIPDPVECTEFANNANERSILEFKNRWSFDPMSGQPITSNSVMEIQHDLKIYNWEPLFSEEEIIPDEPIEQHVDNVETTVTITAKELESEHESESQVLHVTPVSVSAPTSSSSSEIPTRAATTTDDTNCETMPIIQAAIETPIEFIEAAATLYEEEFQSIVCDAPNTSMETNSNTSNSNNTSPRETRFKSPKLMKQCRITDYMQVIKKPRTKKLR